MESRSRWQILKSRLRTIPDRPLFKALASASLMVLVIHAMDPDFPLWAAGGFGVILVELTEQRYLMESIKKHNDLKVRRGVALHALYIALTTGENPMPHDTPEDVRYVQGVALEMLGDSERQIAGAIDVMQDWRDNDRRKYNG